MKREGSRLELTAALVLGLLVVWPSTGQADNLTLYCDSSDHTDRHQRLEIHTAQKFVQWAAYDNSNLHFYVEREDEIEFGDEMVVSGKIVQSPWLGGNRWKETPVKFVLNRNTLVITVYQYKDNWNAPDPKTGKVPPNGWRIPPKEWTKQDDEWQCEITQKQF
jgi:hypothetical protein